MICFIIFLINLSYEYRQIEGFRQTIVPVLPLPTLSPLTGLDNSNFNVYDIQLNAKAFDTSYNNIYAEINNRDVTKDNIKNMQLYEKLNKNLENSEILKNLKANLKNNTSLTSNSVFPIDKLIKTIKSKYNSQYLSLHSNDKKNYGVIINDKCLTVNGLCKEEVCLFNCQNNLYSSDSQKFKPEKITGDGSAATAMNVTLDKISNKNIYPFNIFKSVVNNNCLTLSNDGITVETCNVNNIKQQWEISPDENLCILK